LNITNLCEDVLGRIWLTTNHFDDSVWVFNTQTQKRQKFSLGTLAPEFVTQGIQDQIKAVSSDKDGMIWLLTQKGDLVCIDPLYDHVSEKLSLDDMLPGFRHSMVDKDLLVVDMRGRFWIAGGGGYLIGPLLPMSDGKISRMRRSKQQKTYHTGRIAQFGSRVILVYEGPSTGIWVVLGDGRIFRYNENKDEFQVVVFDTASQKRIDKATTFDIHEDREGVVWMASNYGLMKLSSSQDQISQLYSNQNGLSNNIVKGVVQDDEGNFWLGTLNGLTKFEPKEEMFINFNVIDAIFQHPVMEVSTGRGLQSRFGRIFFTSRNELVEFAPNRIHSHSAPPSVIVRNVSFYDEQDNQGLSDIPTFNFKQHLRPQSTPIQLKFDQNTIQFDYSGIHFTNPAQNQYAVKLEGLDTEWKNVQTNRTALYTNLRPGNFLFRVKAANSHGVWNETGASFEFVILKPYWVKWWFVIIIAGSIFILVFVIVKLQIYRIEGKNRLLEEHVAERTRTIEETQNKLLIQEKLSSMSKINHLEKDVSTISEQTRRELGEALHDDLCPHLLGVESKTHVLANRLKKQSSDQASLAKEIQEQILAGIRKTRNISRVIAPNYSMDRGLKAAIDELTEHLKQTFGVRCVLSIHGNIEALDQSSEIDLYLIIQEAIYNAIKHGKSGEIQIVLKIESDLLRKLIISDDGSGIGDKENSKGIGIRIMDFRARRLGGNLVVKNGPSGGGMVEMTLNDHVT
jgi:signal transduction histidine kinase